MFQHMMLALSAVLALALGAAHPVEAQPPRTLGAASAVHPEPFALVTTLRELADGRVLVADPLGRSLLALSADLRTSTPLGQLGEGPDEYAQPDAVWPLPGDSTLLVDLGNARLTVIAPDGRFARTLPIVLGGFEPGRPPRTLIPGGVDGLGRLYFRGAPMAVGGAPADSVDVFRFDPATEETERVARVKLPGMQTRESGGANNREVRVSPVPLAASDTWAVAPDGRVAVVRSAPYRLDWVADGEVARSGRPVPYAPVAIRSPEQEEWEEERGRSGGIAMSMDVNNGQATLSLQRMAGGPPSDLASLPWPEAKPPFVEGTVRVDRMARVWVRRSLPAGEPALYDVFDSAGELVASIRFPEGRRLVGFGNGVLYAAHIDEFDLIFLERYPLPAL